MTELSRSITLRAVTPVDRDFLLTVFASTRSNELAALGGNSPEAQAFAQMQFTLQQQAYSAAYPAAENSIILLAEQPIGRMLVERTDAAILLIDIAILNDYRNRGIGSSLIRGLMDEAAGSQKSVRLSVYKSNPAARLYERLGFSLIADHGLYFERIWPSANS